jgi:hypothetical protein
MGNQGEAGGQKENSVESNSPVDKAIEAGWEQGEV